MVRPERGYFYRASAPLHRPTAPVSAIRPRMHVASKFQKPCAFCGMSTAFYNISRGDFTGAYRLNALSLYIYSAFVLNTFCAVLTLKHTTNFIKNLGAPLSSDNILS